MQILIRNLRLALYLWLTLLPLLVACNQDVDTANAQATIVALSTENARLATALALQTPATSTAATPVATQWGAASLTTTTAVTAVSAPEPVAASVAGAGPLPVIIADIALAPAGQTLVDFQVDPAANRLYVSDSGGQVHVLDGRSYALLASLPASATLTLDPAHNRLYAAPGDLAYAEQPAVTVIDTVSLRVVATIPDASHVALDPVHNRLFVGNRLLASNEASAPGVRILDATSLAPLAQSPQVGIPVYNTLRDELLIVAYTLFSADAATGAVKADLLPEISAQSPRWCNGCGLVSNAYLLADEGWLLLEITPLSAGKGAGVYPPLRPLDATTLEPLAQLVPAFQPVCGSSRQLQPAVNGRIMQHLLYSRYVGYNNLLIYDGAGNRPDWRDGLALPFVNANTGQGYVFDWVLDLANLTPIGKLPVRCFLGHDAAAGLLYATQENRLLVLAERGGAPPSEPPAPAAPLPAQPVTQIVVSPGFAQDETLFVISNSAMPYRSTDGGQSWSLLRGGLPSSAEATRRLAISPNFAQDRTLFLGGAVGDGQGEGVWRSLDGGERWQALWTGLTHLRVYDVALSPNFASDQTLVAYARYNRIEPWAGGLSVQRSTDGGLTWTLALTTTSDLQPAAAAALLPTPAVTPTLPIRIVDYGRAIERTSDDGQSWATVTLPQPEGAFVQAIVAAPDNPPGDIVYVLGDYGLWRVREGGAIIEAWADERLAGRDYRNELTTLAVSPRLTDGSHRLLIGTYAGEFWTLNPAMLTWAELAQTVGVITPTVGITATASMTVTATVTPTLLSGEPPTGLYRPQGMFASQWEGNAALQSALGWATAATPQTTAAAAQTFDRGLMIWRGDEQKIYVLYNDRTWQVFADTFVEGQPEFDPTMVVPAGKLQPVRGFGKVWREQPGVADRIGWTTVREQPYDAQVHTFERGFLIRLSGLVYALVEGPDGSRTWQVV